jgi:hypothetical protein
LHRFDYKRNKGEGNRLGHYLTSTSTPPLETHPDPPKGRERRKMLEHCLTNHPYPSFGKGGEVPAFSYWEGKSVIS